MARRVKNLFLKIALGLLLIFMIFAGYMVYKGAINYDKLKECSVKPTEDFCGLREINLELPATLREKVRAKADTGLGKRIIIPEWKAGRTINTTQVQAEMPELFSWYEGLQAQISEQIGEQVYITDPTLPTTCAVLVYEKEGDFINWHYDVNYFNGRFFTLLIPVTLTNPCTVYSYYDKNNVKQEVPIQKGKSILFEGDKVFHMATKFCEGQGDRVVVSVQFSTDPSISLFNRGLMRIKDIAYIG